VYTGSCITISAALGGVQGLVGVKVSVGGTDSALGIVIGLSTCDMDPEGSHVWPSVAIEDNSDLGHIQKLNNNVKDGDIPGRFAMSKLRVWEIPWPLYGANGA
jgi:hypothetical protein